MSEKPRRLPRLAFALGFLLSASARAETAPAQSASLGAAPEFDAWLGTILAASEEAPALRTIDSSLAASDQSILAAQTDSPFTVSSSLSRKDAKPIRASDDKSTETDYNLENSLQYQSKWGLSASVSATAARTERDDVPVPGAPDRRKQDYLTRSQGLSGRVSYDLVKNGDDSPGKAQERLVVANETQKIFRAEGDATSFELGIFNQSLSLYVSLCKNRSLARTAELTAKTISAAKVKVAAKLISYNDFLSFAE